MTMFESQLRFICLYTGLFRFPRRRAHATWTMAGCLPQTATTGSRAFCCYSVSFV